MLLKQNPQQPQQVWPVVRYPIQSRIWLNISNVNTNGLALQIAVIVVYFKRFPFYLTPTVVNWQHSWETDENCSVSKLWCKTGLLHKKKSSWQNEYILLPHVGVMWPQPRCKSEPQNAKCTSKKPPTTVLILNSTLIPGLNLSFSIGTSTIHSLERYNSHLHISSPTSIIGLAQYFLNFLLLGPLPIFKKYRKPKKVLLLFINLLP